MDVPAMRANFAKAAATGDEAPLYFYSHLFLSHPETRDLFPVSMAQQRDRPVQARSATWSAGSTTSTRWSRSCSSSAATTGSSARSRERHAQLLEWSASGPARGATTRGRSDGTGSQAACRPPSDAPGVSSVRRSACQRSGPNTSYWMSRGGTPRSSRALRSACMNGSGPHR